jgi:hypothetical protein
MPKEAEIKKCPSCGKSFECFSENDCWCEGYAIGRKEFADIVGKYDDCLCPDCLKLFAKG